MVRSYDVDILRSGMKIGRDVMDLDGSTVLKQGVILNADSIDKLRKKNIFSVFIDEDEEDEEEVSMDEFMLDSEYLDHYKRTYNLVQNVYYQAARGDGINIRDLDAVLAPDNINLLCDVSTAVTQIHNMSRDGDYVIHHATNVGILAGLMARWLKYPDKPKREIVLSGILSELGKMKVPPEILNKKGKLEPEEMDIVKRHVDYGYDMLKVSPLKIFRDVLMGVLQHHERCDGSGYPNRLRGDEISDFGKIIAIVDIYDAMAANRSYARRNSPFDIFNVLFKDISHGKLDKKFGLILMFRLRHSFNGCWVGLTNGKRAKIVEIDEMRVTDQPIVKTLKGEVINLNETPDLKVEAMLTAKEI
ncbi:MAG: HD domain-containing protein [Selenomonadaceae bacterium]|nr:HD domain-containing protein [Selenomonadaceae bacterium]